MAKVELVMPKMGESIMEATILSWLKKEGDHIEADESVLEVATDKVDTEVPTTYAGVLSEILAKEGDVVPVGEPIAIISTNGEDSTSSNGTVMQEKAAAAPEPVAAQQEATAPMTAAAPTSTEKPPTGRFYSPLVLNIARQENISMVELEQMPGTGKDQRVTKKDILAYLKNRGAQPSAPEPAPVTGNTGTTSAPAPSAHPHAGLC